MTRGLQQSSAGAKQQAAEEDAYGVDGGGQLAKLAVTTRTESIVGDGPQTYISQTTTSTYYLRSTVMSGFVIDEINPQGNKTKGYVYAGGERLAEHETGAGSNTITWQHKNPMTGSWIETTAAERGAVRSEVDAMGRDVGISAPPNPLGEPTAPPTRSPMYLENLGGQTIEAELGMQLYEDFYINKNYGGGAGPGQGNFWDQWYRHAAEREAQLAAGGHFLFGMDKMMATSAVANSQYEWVDEGYDTYSNVEASQDESGEWHGGMTITHVNLGHFRLLPGTGAPQKKAKDSFLSTDIDAARSKVKNDQYCRQALNTLIQRTVGDNTGFQDMKMDAAGKLIPNDIFDGLDRLSKSTVIESGGGVTRDGSVEYINGLSVDNQNIYVRSIYRSPQMSQTEKMLAMLHEALHKFEGFTDQALAEAIRHDNRKPYARDKNGQREASIDLTNYIRDQCGLKTTGVQTNIELGP